MKKILHATVKDNVEIARDVFRLTVLAPEAAAEAAAGQFANLYTESAQTLLPRPISICDADVGAGTITFVYGVVGTGTREISGYRRGHGMRISTPLGNGFDISKPGNNALLIGGGIGVPPMLLTAKRLRALGISVSAVLGFRDEAFLTASFTAAGVHVYPCIQKETGDDVLDLIRRRNLTADSCYACGPKPMLFALTDYFATAGRDIQISMEERMGCGYGACVGCVCDIRDRVTGEVTRKKVCKDGPVFWGSEVVRA